MKKKRLVIILTSVILTVIALMITFITILSFKLSLDINEQYHQKYELYDFSQEDVLINYGEYISITNSYNDNDDEDFENNNYYNYEKSYGSDDKISYLLSVKADGTLTKQLFVSRSQEYKLGKPPCFTKKLNDEQIQELKNKITKSEIKVILKNERGTYSSSYYSYAESSSDRFISVNADSKTYTVKYSQIESNHNTKALYDYLLSLTSEEDNIKFNEMKDNYYEYQNFSYDFNDPKNDYIMIYSEELYNTEDPVSESFLVSVRLHKSGNVATIGTYSANNPQQASQFMKYHDAIKTYISNEEIEEIKDAIEKSGFIEYGTPLNLGYEPPASAVANKGAYYMCKYITIGFNGKNYYAIDDGTNPKITELKNKYLDIVLMDNDGQ